MLACVTHCVIGLALLAMCTSLIKYVWNLFYCSHITYNLAIKAERMKKKLTGGKKKVEIEEIKVKIQRRRIHMLTVDKR